ncbi:MAG: hypothetical protein DMF81_21995, partial [Acidobacteria bacterium]
MALTALPAIPLGDGGDAGTGVATHAEGRRALLAGLDSSSRREASRWLASAAFEVIPAEDAARALELYSQHLPDVVLVDMTLRVADGRPLVPAVRAQADARDVAVIALCWNRREARAAMEAGASDVLERPFDWRL